MGVFPMGGNGWKSREAAAIRGGVPQHLGSEKPGLPGDLIAFSRFPPPYYDEAVLFLKEKPSSSSQNR
jgi:hypothetical protein